MANTRPSVNKRRKEANRREKKAAKAEKRAARTADKGPKLTVAPGENDPDIAGIVPGPQPLPWAEFADIEPEEEESDEQEESEETASKA